MTKAFSLSREQCGYVPLGPASGSSGVSALSSGYSTAADWSKHTKENKFNIVSAAGKRPIAEASDLEMLRVSKQLLKNTASMYAGCT